MNKVINEQWPLSKLKRLHPNGNWLDVYKRQHEDVAGLKRMERVRLPLMQYLRIAKESAEL